MACSKPGCFTDVLRNNLRGIGPKRSEIVIAGARGLEFELLQLRIHPAASRVKLLAQQTPASIVFFDLLCAGDRDLRGEPFKKRRQEMESLLASAAPPVHLTPVTHEARVASDWFR